MVSPVLERELIMRSGSVTSTIRGRNSEISVDMKLDTVVFFMEWTFITRVIQIQVCVEEHLIIRSWFVLLLLCDENKSYINLMHAQNMSHSKPKKSLVTIQRGQ